MKIVVAEDEKITRQWLGKTIGSYGTNYQCCLVSNGKQALEECAAHGAEVLITDIQMPVMDGLTLIEKAKEVIPKLRVVVLSAYDQFSYARQAMRLGVDEFLLKPEITREGLKECLDKFSEELEEHSDKKDSGEKYLLELLNNELTADEESIQENFDHYHIGLAEGSLVVLVCQIKEENAEKGEKLLELSKMLMEDALHAGVCFILEGHSLVLLSNAEEEAAYSFSQKLYSLFEQHTNQPVCLGISRGGDGFLRLPDLFRQAVAAAGHSVFYGGGICQYSNLSRDMASFYSDVKFSGECKKVRSLITDAAYKEAYEEAGNILDHIQEEKLLAPSAVRTLVVEFLTLYMQSLRAFPLSGEEALFASEIDLSESGRKVSIQELLSWWKNAADELLRMLARHSKAYTPSVQTVIHYVREHFSEEISLEKLAGKVFLNPSYLSTLFKKETGESLSDYIAKVRMEQACFFLTHTQESIVEISQKTGFSDISYFSRIFKKHMGISPSEYRGVK